MESARGSPGRFSENDEHCGKLASQPASYIAVQSSYHPILWKFLSQLMNDCLKQKASFLQGSTGIERPAVKRYRILRHRVMSRAHSFPRQNLTNSSANLVNSAARQMKFRGSPGIYS